METCYPTKNLGNQIDEDEREGEVEGGGATRGGGFNPVKRKASSGGRATSKAPKPGVVHILHILNLN